MACRRLWQTCCPAYVILTLLGCLSVPFRRRHPFMKPPICNVIFSRIGKPFAEWVERRIDARNKEAVKKADGMIAMDPRIAAAFKASTHVSSKCPRLRFEETVS